MGVTVRAGWLVLAMGVVGGMAMGQAAGTAAGDGTPLRLVMTLKGRGVQIYNCQRRPGEAAAWVLRAPEAELLDGSWNDAMGEAAVEGNSAEVTAGAGEAGSAAAKAPEEAGKVVGHHSAGPVWRLEDGSAVHGVVIEKTESPEAGAVPWLVLRTTEPSGQGKLTGVVEIRRQETHGGVAPATGCSAETVGVEQRVPYTAMYRFYAAGKP